MPRFNVEKDGQWACFSTIVDDFVTPFMPLGEYEIWRQQQYGSTNIPISQANRMTYGEAVEKIKIRKEWEDEHEQEPENLC